MIEKNKNSIIIRDVDLLSEEYKNFSRTFSLYNSVTHKVEYNIFTVIGNDIHMPGTISPNLVQTYFPNHMIAYGVGKSPRGDTINFKMVHSPRTIIQQESLNFLREIKTTFPKYRMLNLATGSGKTFVTIAMLSELKQKACIIVDTVDLANQWKNEILNHSDLKDEDIMILSGRESIEVAKNGDYKIFIALHKTLGMIIDDGENALNKLMRKLHIGVRVFDECHVNFVNICKINSLSDVNYSIFLTATPNRSDYKEDILYHKVFDGVPSYDGHKSENERYHKVVLASFDSHPSDKQKLSVKTKYGFSSVKWAGFLATDSCYDYYIKSVFTIIKKFQLIERGTKFAIMLPTIELIDKTYDDLKKEYAGLSIGRFIGEIPKEKRSTELNKTVILTNNKIFGKGIDVPDLDCIINYVQLSSAVNLEQIIGRLRNNAGHSHVVIDITDAGYTECKNQLKFRKRFYKKVAKEIKELTDSL